MRNALVINRTANWITLGGAAATPTNVLDSEQALILDEKTYDPNPATAGCVVKFELQDTTNRHRPKGRPPARAALRASGRPD